MSSCDKIACAIESNDINRIRHAFNSESCFGSYRQYMDDLIEMRSNTSEIVGLLSYLFSSKCKSVEMKEEVIQALINLSYLRSDSSVLDVVANLCNSYTRYYLTDDQYEYVSSLRQEMRRFFLVGKRPSPFSSFNLDHSVLDGPDVSNE